MAYTFASASNQYLSVGAAPATAAPITMACWVNQTAGGALMYLGSGNSNDQLFLYTGSNAFFFIRDSTGFEQVTGAAITSSTWTHVCGVYVSSSVSRIYTNGTLSNSGVPNKTPANLASVTIGGRFISGTLDFKLSGQIADAGIWNTDLSASEIASLAKGVSCRLVRPQSLVFYAPLIRELVDLARGRTITNNNTATVSAHPRIYL